MVSQHVVLGKPGITHVTGIRLLPSVDPEKKPKTKQNVQALQNWGLRNDIQSHFKQLCYLWCVLRAELWEKRAPHSSQLYGLSPVWVLSCRVRAVLELRDLPQVGQ